MALQLFETKGATSLEKMVRVLVGARDVLCALDESFRIDILFAENCQDMVDGSISKRLLDLLPDGSQEMDLNTCFESLTALAKASFH